MSYTAIEQVWTNPELPQDISDVLYAVDDELLGDPEFTSVRISGIESDWEDDVTYNGDLTIHVEIAPGLILPYLHMADGELELAEAADYIVSEIRAGVKATLLRKDRFSAAADQVRREARRIMADWRDEGLACSVVRVLLEAHEGWYMKNTCGFSVEIGCLGHRLEPSETQVFVESPAELRAELKYIHERQQIRNKLKTALDREAADGSIDEAALVALRREEKPVDVLARLLTADSIDLSDGTRLMWSEGRVWCGHGLEDGASSDLIANRISVRDMPIDHAAMSAAVGHAASTLFSHPLLTNDMRIRSIEKDEEKGVVVVEATLDMPSNFFCATTGRTWPQPRDCTFASLGQNHLETSPAQARQRPKLRLV